MRKNKKLLLFSLSFLIIVICSIFLVIKYIENKKVQSQLDYVYSIYNDENKKDVILDTNTNTVGVSIQSIENNVTLNTVGTLEIPSIHLKNFVVEGTDQEALANGIGLFEHSNILQGNVCIAGHNTNKFFANLKKVKLGDHIKYNTCLGNREYEIETIKEISEKDWSLLEQTNDNRITIITCVRGKKDLRLCVQAVEIK